MGSSYPPTSSVFSLDLSFLPQSHLQCQTSCLPCRLSELCPWKIWVILLLLHYAYPSLLSCPCFWIGSSGFFFPYLPFLHSFLLHVSLGFSNLEVPTLDEVCSIGLPCVACHSLDTCTCTVLSHV